MRLPVRKSQLLRDRDHGPVLLTREGVKKLERDRDRLQRERPQVVEELSVTLAKGDLSENAEYRDARDKLNRIDSRVFSITDRLKRVQIIEPTTSHTVVLGSIVLLEVDGTKKEYEIVGPSETQPARGRISHLSPLGRELIGKSVGDVASVPIEDRTKSYRILEIN